MVKKLVIPAIVGVVIGVVAISFLGEGYAKYVKPLHFSLHFISRSFKIFQNSVLKKTMLNIKKRKPILKRLVFRWFYRFVYWWWLGPWGYRYTYQNGYTPRYVVGSSTVAKFILTVISAIAFYLYHWYSSLEYCFRIINWRYCNRAIFLQDLHLKIPSKYMFIAVGVLVMTLSVLVLPKKTILSFKILYLSEFQVK